MSPASNSKSKDKKVVKETQMASPKPSGAAISGNGVPASAYDPLLGTFHTIETMTSSSALSLQNNGRFRNIDESDDQLGGSLGAGVEYDSLSNNGSWSGESEDHKEKISNLPARQEVIPGADIDKREKIRQKNEKKHQRQKERRAQELHERCSGYLMSRKLEALAQQLVAMGFSHDRATMALILNEGKVEESVAWLFEGGEEAVKHNESTVGGGNLKIDISEELARITDMEIRYKCTKQEVERAVVAAEGDLEKAAGALRTLKQDRPCVPPKPEETCDPPTASSNKVSVPTSQNLSVRPQPKPNLSSAVLQRRDEKDFDYTKAAVTIGGSSESISKSFQPLKRIQLKLEWSKLQQSAASGEKKWLGGASNPSVSYSVTAPHLAKTETPFIAGGSDFRNLQSSVSEPVIMMQRPQSVNTKQIQATGTSSLSGRTSFVYPTSSVEITKSNGFIPHPPSARSVSLNNFSSNQMHHQVYHPQQQHLTSSGSGDCPVTSSSRGNGLWSRTGTSPTIAAASSLGLFTSLGCTYSSGASSPVDWSSGSSMAQLDYTNIDWSLDRGRPSGLWVGPTSPINSSHMYFPNIAKPTLRYPSNGRGLDGGVALSESSTAEWTSPFEGKDLFSLPRQFVSSPSL